MKQRILPLLLLVAITLVSFTIPTKTPPPTKWKLKHNKKGTKIYIRKSAEGLSEFKATTTLTGSFDAFVAVIDDHENHVNWMDGISKAELHKKVNDKEKYLYYVVPMPWPMKNRDVVTHNSYKQSKNNLKLFINGKPKMKAKTKYTRIKQSVTTWTITPKGNNKLDIIYQAKTETGGAPHGIVSMFLVNSPKKSLRNLQKMMDKPKYKNAKIKWLKKK